MNRLWKKIEDLNVAIVGIGKEMDELKDKVHKYEKEVKKLEEHDYCWIWFNSVILLYVLVCMIVKIGIYLNIFIYVRCSEMYPPNI